MLLLLLLVLVDLYLRASCLVHSVVRQWIVHYDAECFTKLLRSECYDESHHVVAFEVQACSRKDHCRIRKIQCQRLRVDCSAKREINPFQMCACPVVDKVDQAANSQALCYISENPLIEEIRESLLFI